MSKEGYCRLMWYALLTEKFIEDIGVLSKICKGS